MGKGEDLAANKKGHVVRLGVTGLSRAGKTVFITSLVASLKNPENMVELVAAREERIEAAHLPPPKGAVPSFPFQEHLDTIVSGNWPPGTRSLSRLRLSLLIRKKSGNLVLLNEKTVHLDIIDFPGEWLIDLTMMEKSFVSWSVECLERITFEALDGREEARTYLQHLQRMNTEEEFDIKDADYLAGTFTAYLNGVGSFGLMSGQGGWPMTVQRECSKASLGFSSSCRTWTQQSWTIDSQKTNPLVFLRRLCRREPSNGVSLSDSGMPPDGQGGRAIIV